ncbi:MULTISPECIES: YhbD family protein [Thermoactinomyces]|jgi:DNA-binding transcriptional MerR regulator|uniref:YhbD family protein n=1 Tax=Thermoactinomyces daqus TaxID=1329516 RepID=A0A7W1XC65_9BACL|nr:MULTISPECIES: YhbD family protein [Thermoactinomyces]MBA4543863.1 YhbD family protein [Thermoactinomyces daqus]MBH8599396.1 YhbD family protein [Thermoactinomyces sp. CICC 10523]MBH8605178.1 YhbD family protein [Thermoactinomyces sp. CICC 10522]MBH8608282.1 YhbD family protein [Thermoactinomyces sp. CICC 10521]
MEQELISKKELLEMTGISYGQLYRWKRKNLIPEDWFIRKSTYTGQETFFPREKILGRINKIKSMKDDLSLDEIARHFMPDLKQVTLSKEECLKRNIVSELVVRIFTEQNGEKNVFTFDQIFQLFVLEKALQSGQISLEEGKLLLKTLVLHAGGLKGKNGELVFIRKMGVSAFILAGATEIFFDPEVNVLLRLSLADLLEELRLRME